MNWKSDVNKFCLKRNQNDNRQCPVLYKMQSLLYSDLRDCLNGAESKEDLDSILAEKSMSFSAPEFEEAYNHTLTLCQESDEAEQLKELKMWWYLLGQLLELSKYSDGCKGCC